MAYIMGNGYMGETRVRAYCDDESQVWINIRIGNGTTTLSFTPSEWDALRELLANVSAHHDPYATQVEATLPHDSEA